LSTYCSLTYIKIFEGNFSKCMYKPYQMQAVSLLMEIKSGKFWDGENFSLIIYQRRFQFILFVKSSSYWQLKLCTV
jgi:hypothetical protein